MGDRLQRLKAAVGIETADCDTCELGFAEHDGENGELYCGFFCSHHDKYLEDVGVDVKAEKECWQPDFWYSGFMEDVKSGTTEELDAAFARFKAAADEAEAEPAP